MKLIPRNRKMDGARTHLPEVFSRFRSEMDGLFDRFLREPLDLSRDFFGKSSKWMPAAEVIDRERDVMVKIEIPGVDPKDLDISVSGNVLSISGEKRESKEEKHEGFLRSERSFGSFHRSLELPSTVDTDKVTADYSKGILTVRFEKHAGAKPKKIAVRSQTA